MLEYLWEEEVALQDDESQGMKFGNYAGKTMNLQCGGTLVFDDRGNLLSWFRKPGTEHITPERVQELRQRQDIIRANPAAVNNKKIRLTLQDLAELADLEEGQRRKAALSDYTARVIKRGLVGEAQAGNPLMAGMRPLFAIEEDGVLRLEIAPHLRGSDFDSEVGGWLIDY